MNGQHLLTVSTGSSSLKAALYRVGAKESRLLSVRAERIWTPGSCLRLEDSQGDTLDEPQDTLPDHPAALGTLLDWLRIHGWDLTEVGHRVVHGGDRYSEPRIIDDEVTGHLRKLVPVDPEHMPRRSRP